MVYPVIAHVWQLGRLFERVALVPLGDRLLGLERCASWWYFARLASAPRAETRFTQKEVTSTGPGRHTGEQERLAVAG